jgi:hypothetical protein
VEENLWREMTKSEVIQRILVLGLVTKLIFYLSLQGQEASPTAGGIIELQGRIVTLPNGATNLALKTETGEVYRLKRTEMSEAFFLDTNLHSKVLVLKGRVEGKDFEVTGNVHSIKDGKLHEIYYYCDICAITTSLPGICLCCREPVELRETPK